MEYEREQPQKHNGFFGRLFLYLPVWSFVLLCLALSAVAARLIARHSVPFADGMNHTVGAFVRLILAKLTGWFPFSLAEVALIALPVILFVVVYLLIRSELTVRRLVRFCLAALSLLVLGYTLFVYGYSMAYHGTALEDYLGLERREESAQELYETAIWIGEKLNREAGAVFFADSGASVMPVSLSGMNDELMAAYDAACDRYPFLQRMHSRIKPVILSEAMSYTHITGVYSVYTGEANINIVFPDYSVVFTAAHELAHQRGIAREDEANFVAFLVLKDAPSAYFRYCAWMNLFEYVGNSLFGASPEMYYTAYSTLCAGARGEMAAYNEVYNKYKDSTASKVTDTVNDTYLKWQGTPGSASYGLVTDLAVAYYRAAETQD